MVSKRKAAPVKAPVSVRPPSTRCGGAYQDKGINYSLRISQDTLDRLKRVTEVLGPRFRSLLGRLPRDSDMARAVMDRGLCAMEREFGIGEEKEGFVLVDSLEDFEES